MGKGEPGGLPHPCLACQQPLAVAGGVRVEDGVGDGGHEPAGVDAEIVRGDWRWRAGRASLYSPLDLHLQFGGGDADEVGPADGKRGRVPSKS